MLLAKASLPIVLLIVIVGAGKLKQRIRNRRNKAEQAASPAP